MEELFAKEEKIEILTELDQALRNAVHDALPSTVSELIERGADADCRVAGNPLICLAAMAATIYQDGKDRAGVVEALIEGGADVAAEDSTGRTALDWLSGSQSEQMAHLAGMVRAAKRRRQK